MRPPTMADPWVSAPIQDATSFVRFELASPHQPKSQPKGTGQTKLRLE